MNKKETYVSRGRGSAASEVPRPTELTPQLCMGILTSRPTSIYAAERGELIYLIFTRGEAFALRGQLLDF